MASQEAEEALELEAKRRTIGEQRVGADDITGRHKKRKTKEERLESIMTGREVRNKIRTNFVGYKPFFRIWLL